MWQHMWVCVRNTVHCTINRNIIEGTMAYLCVHMHWTLLRALRWTMMPCSFYDGFNRKERADKDRWQVSWHACWMPSSWAQQAIMRLQTYLALCEVLHWSECWEDNLPLWFLGFWFCWCLFCWCLFFIWLFDVSLILWWLLFVVWLFWCLSSLTGSTWRWQPSKKSVARGWTACQS